MTSQQWKFVKYGSGGSVVLAMLLLMLGATVPVFVTVALVALACAGVFKYADKREGEALAEEQRSR